MKKTLFIMCGLPFSGKSLLSQEIEESTSIIRIGFDDIWNQLLLKIPDLTYETTKDYIDNLLSENLLNGFSIIYDSTNLSEKNRTNLIYLAEKSGANAIIVHIPTTVEETYERQAQSILDKTHHNVDLKNIDIVIENMEIPVDAIHLVTEKDKKDFIGRLMVEFPKG